MVKALHLYIGMALLAGASVALAQPQPPMPPAPSRLKAGHQTKAMSPKVAAMQPKMATASVPLVGSSASFTNHLNIMALVDATHFVYVIQRSTNLQSGIWQDVAMFDNTNTPGFWNDRNAPAAAFYRGGAFPYAQTNQLTNP